MFAPEGYQVHSLVTGSPAGSVQPKSYDLAFPCFTDNNSNTMTIGIVSVYCFLLA